MMNTHPSSEIAGERFFLIEYVEIYGGRHLTAKVVRAAVPKEQNEDGSTKKYNDGLDAIGYRNTSWMSTKDNASYIEDFAVHAYVDVDTNKVFGVCTVFKDAHMIEVRDAVAMVNTLNKINRSLKRQDEVDGYLNSEDFAGMMIRVAKALGIKQYVFRRARGDLTMTDAYTVHGPQYLRDVVRHMIDKGPLK